MFKKVLVAEDLDSISIAVVQVLEELEVPVIDHVKYCDEGLLKVKKALLEKEPYDLLITDLSFKLDHRKADLTSGDELIEAVNHVQPELKKNCFFYRR
ncbi:hypothetical protein [Flavobacterium sp. CGRL2]